MIRAPADVTFAWCGSGEGGDASGAAQHDRRGERLNRYSSVSASVIMSFDGYINKCDVAVVDAR